MIKPFQLEHGMKLERKCATLVDNVPVIAWVEGTVIGITDDFVDLEYNDGSRESVERNRGFMRRP